MGMFSWLVCLLVNVNLPHELQQGRALLGASQANEAGPTKLEALPKPEWSKYGRLSETQLRCENGQPIYALKDDDKLIAYVAAKPGKSLKGFLGRPVSVYGSLVTQPNEKVQYILATHVADPEPDDRPPPPSPETKLGVKAELQGFQNIWTPVSAIFDGKPQEKDAIKDCALVIIGAKVLATRKQKEVGASYMAVDPSKNPAHLDVTYESGLVERITSKAIYKFEEDTLTICIASPGKDRPAEFKSEPGSGARLYVLKRAK
jgi:uncharacterized protein (TIGR03067 family)